MIGSAKKASRREQQPIKCAFHPIRVLHSDRRRCFETEASFCTLKICRQCMTVSLSLHSLLTLTDPTDEFSESHEMRDQFELTKRPTVSSD